jgi:hypothetical protein
MHGDHALLAKPITPLFGRVYTIELEPLNLYKPVALFERLAGKDNRS